MKKLLLIFSLLLMLNACNNTKTEDKNPFFSEFTTPDGVPPFDKIKTEHFMPAYKEAFKQKATEVEAIANNAEPATFENTVVALNNSGQMLRSVSNIFGALKSTGSTPELNEISKEVSPLSAESSDNVYLNDKLFERIKSVYSSERRGTMTTEQNTLVEDYYKDFVRSGAELDEKQKERLREINKELGAATLAFSDNAVAEGDDFKLVIDDKKDLAGLPEDVIAMGAQTAKKNGQEGKWMFTLSKPSWEPFLKYADNRALREKLYKAMYMRGDNDNAHDNKEVINKIVNLRTEKAQMLGFKSHADFVLDRNMAKTPETAIKLLKSVWDYALPQAKKELADLQAIANKLGHKIKIESWDWSYYAEKVRAEKYALNEEEIKPYFMIDNVRDGVFAVAHNLYGINFKQRDDLPVFQEGVKAFEVTGEKGEQIGYIYLDYFARDGKKAGAWMSSFRKQEYRDGKKINPIVYNSANFTPPVGDQPVLLTLREVETMFHEFGHGLHGLLSDCQYYALSGTSVSRDFVELPSQIMEHWAFEPEVLKMYAKHYKTGEIIPDALVNKIEAASHFNMGFITTEFVAAALLDMKYYTREEIGKIDVRKFEADAMKEIGLISEIIPRYRSTYFLHIFSGGYSAGYYAYMWSEVLDSDAFHAFVETGNIFDPATAKSFRENVLSKGGSDDSMTLYKRFRGAEPNPIYLLKNRGFVK